MFFVEQCAFVGCTFGNIANKSLNYPSSVSGDKAGAYAIQGLASKFVERVEGCYFNVVGLPIALVYRLLKELR